MVRVGGSWTVDDAGMVVEVGADAVEAVGVVNAAGTIERALAAVAIGGIDSVVEDGAAGKAKPIELDIGNVAYKAVLS